MHTHMFMYCMCVCVLIHTYTVEFGCNVIEGTEYFVSLYMSVVTTEGYNVMFNGDELIGTTEHLTLQARCCIY